VDDAHAVGVLGENGRGTKEHYQIENDRCQATGTLSKALGGWGGVIWGKTDWIENIDRNSRVMAGASPPPLVMAAASACPGDCPNITRSATAITPECPSGA